MRAIQAGILTCLVVITGLLAAIYQQQTAYEADAAATVEKLAEAQQIQAPAPPLADPDAAPPDPRPVAQPIVHRSFAAPAAPAQRPAVSRSLAPVELIEQQPEPQPTATTGAELTPQAELPPSEPSQPQELAHAEPRFAEPLEEEVTPEPREPRTVTIPAGQRLVVRLDNTLSTARNRVDDTFFATLDQTIIVDGLVIADEGARVQGRIVEAQQAGRVRGRARLVCELTHLDTDDGQRVEIRSSIYALDGTSSKREDMKTVAIGAGAGAVLGAIFGGGKGAAIGAGSGAGVGAGTAAARRGEPAVIEPETMLDFRLTDGVDITEKL